MIFVSCLLITDGDFFVGLLGGEGGGYLNKNLSSYFTENEGFCQMYSLLKYSSSWFNVFGPYKFFVPINMFCEKSLVNYMFLYFKKIRRSALLRPIYCTKVRTRMLTLTNKINIFFNSDLVPPISFYFQRLLINKKPLINKSWMGYIKIW